MEYYGLVWHMGASAVAYDADRISTLASKGWLPLIFTDESTEKTVIEQVTDALRQSGLLD